MKIGIIGGTFDPIHHGHLLIAEQARTFVGLDEVWFIPAGHPPHKQGEEITPAVHRLEMVKLAIKQNCAFRVLDWEIKREKLSYTVDTVNWLTNQYPDYQFYLIAGTDMVNNLPKWYQIEEIVKHVSIIAMRRPGFEPESLPIFIQQHVYWVAEAAEIMLSASYLRQIFASGKSARYMIPDAVCQYIKEHQLYGSPDISSSDSESTSYS